MAEAEETLTVEQIKVFEIISRKKSIGGKYCFPETLKKSQKKRNFHELKFGAAETSSSPYNLNRGQNNFLRKKSCPSVCATENGWL